ncbi:hypothetical protein ACTMTI_56710 [Nonomuraea sp. H19]|uniref:hypothetical protein n=1 Tax=Nonomuraea sp. H19 TaxID=3452206 RepID=UPI003F8B688B
MREELLKHLREERIEPPTPGRISRIVASALHNAEVAWSVRICSRLSPETTERIYTLVGIDDGGRAVAEAVGDGQEPISETAAEDDDESSTWSSAVFRTSSWLSRVSASAATSA